MKNIFKNYKISNESKTHFKIKSITGPSRLVKIPKELDENLAIFVGMILGDGHLDKNKKRISLDSTDLRLIRAFKALIEINFDFKIKIKKYQDKRPNRKLRYYTYTDNSAIYTLLNKVYNVPASKKSAIISVPEKIKKSGKNIKIAFLMGVFVTDGGKRHRSFGLSSKSKLFRDGLINILNELNIKTHKDEWINKKYRKRYYGLYFNKRNLETMRECRSGQTGQILNLIISKLEGQA